jgi:hypothetical protein
VGDEGKVEEGLYGAREMKERKGENDLKRSREGSEQVRSITPRCVRSHSC